MRILAGAVAALLAAETTGFLSGHHPTCPAAFRTRNPLSMVAMASAATGTDVSIPYDSAARLAYDEWRVEYNKGDFDEKRYAIFNNNYQTITVANVKAKKKAREDDTVSLSLMSLNEFGDFTKEEYMQVVGGGSAAAAAATAASPPPQPTRMSTLDVLGDAVKAAELQTEASNALEAASDALAIEEQKLVDALGLESVEELEIAIDSLEGIAPDGGELETSNIAREARVRDAYLNWCKEAGKEPSEPRFEAFSQNFLFMEQYEKSTGKEMTLNQYADYTKEEYEAMKKEKAAPPPKEDKPKPAAPSPKAEVKAPPKPPAAPAKVAEKPKPPPPASKPPTPVERDPIITAEAVQDVGKNIAGFFGSAAEFAQAASKGIKDSIRDGLEEVGEGAAAENAALRDVRAAEMAVRTAEAEKAASELRDQRAKELVNRAKLEAQRRKEIEKARADREKQKAAEMAKAQAEAEKAAIAAAKAAQEKEETFSLQRAYFEQQAAEEVLRKAREFEAKQQQLEAQKRAAAPPATAPAPNVFKNVLSGRDSKPMARPQAMASLRPPAPKVAPKQQPMKKVVLKKAPVMKAPAKISSPTLSLFNMGASPKKAAKSVASPTISLFGAQAAKKTATKVAPPKAAAPKVAPKAAAPKAVAPKPAAPKVAAQKAAGTFSLFSLPQKKAAPKKVAAVAPAPAPAPQKKAAAPAFSLFGSAPKKAARPASEPVTPPPAKAAPAFSFFGSAPKKAAPPASVPVTPPPQKAAPAPAFSFFGSPPKSAPPAPVAPAPAPKQAKAAAPAFSLFGNAAPKAMKQAVEPKVPNRQGTLNVFGGNGGPKKAKVVPKVSNRGGTMSLFGAGSPKKAASAPKGSTVSPKKQGGGFFGAPMAMQMAAAPEPVAAKSAPAPKAAFSLFGGSKPMSMAAPAKKAAPPKGVPTLSRWRQNPDGSITGKVSGSPNFRAGTEITTSPVQKGAAAGSLVKTGSGSQYFLS